MRQHALNESGFGFRSFIAGPNLFLQALVALLQRGDISQNEFGVDYFNVANWINRSAHVVDIIVRKASDHLNNPVPFSAMPKNLFTNTFPPPPPPTQPPL